jgi:TfoX/Sxy family transcriptional regulator of competence genes
MKEYVTLPEACRDEPERARAWVVRSVEWVAGMPAKAVKKRKR